MEYEWNVHGIYESYVWILYGACVEYVRNLHGRFVHGMRMRIVLRICERNVCNIYIYIYSYIYIYIYVYISRDVSNMCQICMGYIYIYIYIYIFLLYIKNMYGLCMELLRIFIENVRIARTCARIIYLWVSTTSGSLSIVH